MGGSDKADLNETELTLTTKDKSVTETHGKKVAGGATSTIMKKVLLKAKRKLHEKLRARGSGTLPLRRPWRWRGNKGGKI